MREPVLILSDLHLGHAASRIDSVEHLRPLLEGAGTVVFNGDTFQELARAFRPRSEALLRELRALCDEMGIETVFLPGNHDPGWGGKGWLELAEGKIIVTHGDGVMWGGSPWSRESFERSEGIRKLWAENVEADLDPEKRLELAREVALLLKPPSIPKGRSFVRRAMDALHPPRRAFEILRVWWDQANRAEAFLRRYFPEAEVLVLGHFHRMGVWQRNGALIINTGAYVSPHRAKWVSFADGWLRSGKVEEKDGEFRRGESEEVWAVGRESRVARSR